MKSRVFPIVLLLFIFVSQSRDNAAEIARGTKYSVLELRFDGPGFGPLDAPAMDVDFRVAVQHESGSPEFSIHGFWDGDGLGGNRGGVFCVRFCPTDTGRWYLSRVESNLEQLNGQKEGDSIMVTSSDHPGFWIVDDESNGRRWYRRSNGSHPYIFGNTHYSFLSGFANGNEPSGNDIASDIASNARYFQKLRFGISGDWYTNPDHKPFLDHDGRLTDSGDHSHRPNPEWFRRRVDTAVWSAHTQDLIADIILAGPDKEWSRSTLRARDNNGDPTPFLKYIAARYGSFPNVWFCLCNEYEIRVPTYSEKELARFGSILRKYLPYSTTPISVHSTPRTLWSPKFAELPQWYDHKIIQKKIRRIAPAADIMIEVGRGSQRYPSAPMPVVNDELSYQGQGDRHSEEDTIEAHLGAFLGGGYASTGEKSGNKLGQYFIGGFDAEVHSAADNLKWLRETINENIWFWKMAPDASIFENLEGGFRGMAWEGQEYVLGTNEQRTGIVANLPEGLWTVTMYDAIQKSSSVISRTASGRFTFSSPDRRAVLFHFARSPDPLP
jgi:hypothetical protein